MKILNQLFKQPYLYVVIVIIGISLKFYKVDQQFFWDDEIATILHTSGIPMSEYEKNIPVNVVLPKQYFDNLLKLNDRDLKFFDQIIGLSKMPQVTPGHYYYFIFLTRIFGDNYMVYRYFSVFVFLISVVFLYLLTKKIFKSNRIAWIAISFYTVSPFFQLYAQEARYYILWASAIVIMHYLFLIAIEKKKLQWWIVYVVAGFFAVHITILFYITLLAQFIYFLIFYRERWKSLFMSQFAIFLTSVPWLIYIVIHRENIHSSLEWHKTGSWANMNVFDLLVVHYNHFIDVFAYFKKLGISNALVTTGRWFYGLLIAGGVYIFFRKAEHNQKWLIGLMTFLGVIAIVSLDLIRSSGSSSLSRYVLLNFIGLIILLSFSFEQAMEKRRILFGFLFLIIISTGILSSYAVSDNLAYGKRADSYYHVQDATQKFSGEERILIISDFTVTGPYAYSAFMSLTHASTNGNMDIIYAKPDYPDFKKEFDLASYQKVYGMYLSAGLQEHLRNNFTPEGFKLVEERIIYRNFNISVYGIESQNELLSTSE